MTSAPTGQVVAWLFTDIVKSSLLNSRSGDSHYLNVVARFEEIVRSVLVAYDVQVRSIEGDSYFVEFQSPLSAVQAALELQRRFRDDEHTAAGELRVRMGIDLGEPMQSFSNETPRVHGANINTAAHLCAAALPGQILITDSVFRTTRTLLTDTKAKNIIFLLFGLYELERHTENLVLLYEVGEPDIATFKRPRGTTKIKLLMAAKRLRGKQPFLKTLQIIGLSVFVAVLTLYSPLASLRYQLLKNHDECICSDAIVAERQLQSRRMKPHVEREAKLALALQQIVHDMTHGANGKPIDLTTPSFSPAYLVRIGSEYTDKLKKNYVGYNCDLVAGSEYALGCMSRDVHDVKLASELMQMSIDDHSRYIEQQGPINVPIAKRDLIEAYETLGSIHSSMGAYNAAAKCFSSGHQLAVEVDRDIGDDYNSKLKIARMLEHLGQAQFDAGKVTESEQTRTASLKANLAIWDNHRNDPEVLQNLAIAYDKLGIVELAFADAEHKQRGRAYLKNGLLEITNAFPARGRSLPYIRTFAISSTLFAEQIAIAGDAKWALKIYGDAIDKFRDIRKSSNNSDQSRADLADCLSRYASLLGKNPSSQQAAILAMEEARQILISLVEQEPSNVFNIKNLSIVHCKMGRMREDTHDYESACKEFENADRLLNNIVHSAYEDPGIACLLAVADVSWGDMYVKWQKDATVMQCRDAEKQADAKYDLAFKTISGSFERFPALASVAHEYATSAQRLGEIESRKGSNILAYAYYAAGIPIFKREAENSSSESVQLDYAASLQLAASTATKLLDVPPSVRWLAEPIGNQVSEWCDSGLAIMEGIKQVRSLNEDELEAYNLFLAHSSHRLIQSGPSTRSTTPTTNR